MKNLSKSIFCLLMVGCLLCPMTAFASTGGSGNIDGGGGGMGDGTSTSSWTPGNEGVRVTVVRSNDHAQVITPIDFTNKVPAATIYNFGKISKLQYSNGVMLTPSKVLMFPSSLRKPSPKLSAPTAATTSPRLKSISAPSM